MSDMQAELDELKRKVDFNSYDISVKELLSLVRDGTIDIAPEYQRQFRWKEDRQSELIESVLLGIPIPNLFMATNADGTWELIDGVQRLSTGLDTDLGSIKLERGGHIHAPPHHEALAVMIRDAGKEQPKTGFPLQRPGRVP